MADRERVAHWNQIACLFRAGDRGYDRRLQNRTLFCPLVYDRFVSIAAHRNFTAGDRDPFAILFRAYIDHLRAVFRVDMR
jgi:hypothetical protein